ncbi:hypothetical protein NC653_029164 [Populus alba x Populus x berolinensis]|uniref:Uncharacterized protein n=1 Tax=Populus alba x Populus x berolinensis TaxID=444605 RepID=A0AAD6M1F3_9ROSI|nr:hypothetical protein NC653_029164 [Populus alba x Populus x berolinensis]
MQTMDWNLGAPVIWNLLALLKAGIACNHVVVSFTNWIGDIFSHLGRASSSWCENQRRSFTPHFRSLLLQSYTFYCCNFWGRLVFEYPKKR